MIRQSCKRPAERLADTSFPASTLLITTSVLAVPDADAPLNTNGLP